MSATAAARSVLRFSAVRPATARRLPSKTRPAFFDVPTERRIPPPSLRISRSMSCLVDTLLPYHSANASALINSKLSVSCCAYVWTLDDG
ncbi:unnamed protein product [Linum trigynum]|uniref:Protein NUCLEAR FUSION DEFECTIVE 6, chloroplastic/mitochondrial n=1 Tax=Linum trigynum TaxID=586398 RepID=A0AAV2DGV9_9ROSI